MTTFDSTEAAQAVIAKLLSQQRDVALQIDRMAKTLFHQDVIGLILSRSGIVNHVLPADGVEVSERDIEALWEQKRRIAEQLRVLRAFVDAGETHDVELAARIKDLRERCDVLCKGGNLD